MQQCFFTSLPEIKTQRLILRQLTVIDAPEIFLLRSNEQVNYFISRALPENIEDVTEFINSINEGISKKQWFYWAIILKEDLKLAGTITLWQFLENESSAELGYELHPAHQHKGLMQEALYAITEFAFKNIKLKKLYAWTHCNNASSIKLLKKNNFKKDMKAEKKYSQNSLLKNMAIYFLNNTNH